MKKFVFIFVIMFSAISAGAQSVKSVPLQDGYFIIEKAISDSIANVKRQKFLLANNVSSEVSNYDGFKHIYDAGRSIRLATTYGLCGLGCSLAAGAACTYGFSEDIGGFKIVGIALGVGALVCEIMSLKYHFKSGKELKIGAGSIQYSF